MLHMQTQCVGQVSLLLHPPPQSVLWRKKCDCGFRIKLSPNFIIPFSLNRPFLQLMQRKMSKLSAQSLLPPLICRAIIEMFPLSGKIILPRNLNSGRWFEERAGHMWNCDSFCLLLYCGNLLPFILEGL